MRRYIILSLLILASAVEAVAAPAIPGKFKYTQPDGSVIVLERHGDEFCHWTTNESGVVVVKGEDGFYRPASEGEGVYRKYTSSVSPRRWSSYDEPPVTNFGDRKILAILVNFTDSTFVLSNPRDRFDRLLNEQGYSDNGASGSVRDYYLDNSLNQYRPSFDVYGPVTLSHSSAYYDDRGGSVSDALYEACQMIDDQVDFSKYDTDGDGKIDMVLMYYAGHNEAEGAGEESIWPHRSTNAHGSLDGVSLYQYFCTSELKGVSGTQMCGIGTTCHEFAHSLGLPDMYDTDYQTNGQTAFTTGYFDLMASGNYNDNGRMPPYMNAVERNMLGWMEFNDSMLIESSGSYELASVKDNLALRSNSKTSGEYFVYECRTNTGWDKGLPAFGMLVYQIDKSSRVIGGGYTAWDLWENTNKINAYGNHPCFRLVSPTGVYHDLPLYYDYLLETVFPGQANVTSYSPMDWDGVATGLSLSSINFNGSKVSFQASIPQERWVSGKVQDGFGNPVAGAQVILSKSAYDLNAAPAILPDDVVTTSGSDGTYSLSIAVSETQDRILTVRKDGFIPSSLNIKLDKRYNFANLTLFPIGEGPLTGLNKYSGGSETYTGRLGSASTSGAGMLYTADEISSMGLAGTVLETITFAGAAETYSKCYVFVDFGNTRVFTKEVKTYEPGIYITVDVSSYNAVIPSGKDVVVGYGFTGLSSNEYPFYITGPFDKSNGGNIRYPDFLNSTDWGYTTFGNVIYNFIISANVMAPIPEDLTIYGISYIAVYDSVPVAMPAAGKTVKSTAWYLDGVSVNTPPAVSSLSSGSHTYKAVINFYDGTLEEVYYDYTVPVQ